MGPAGEAEEPASLRSAWRQDQSKFILLNRERWDCCLPVGGQGTKGDYKVLSRAYRLL